MSGRALIPLIAGLGIGGLALKFGLDFVKRAKGAEDEKAQVWVTLQDVPRWTEINEAMIHAVSFPTRAVPNGAFVDKTKLIGRVLRITAPAGLPILETMLLAPGQRPGVVVPEGFRAVAVKIDEGSGVDYHLQPGSHVDVIGFFKIQKGNETDLISRTIVDDVEVAAVGPRTSAIDPNAEGQSSKNGSTRPDKVRAVTLFVKPDQAPLLHMAEQRGKIKLSMRNETQSVAAEEHDSVTEAELLGLSDDKADGRHGGVLGALARMFNKPQPEPTSEPETQSQPQPRPQPTLKWVMRVWNGHDLRMLAWRDLDSIDAIDLSQIARQNAPQERPADPGPPEPAGAPGTELSNELSDTAPTAGAEGFNYPEP